MRGDAAGSRGWAAVVVAVTLATAVSSCFSTARSADGPTPGPVSTSVAAPGEPASPAEPIAPTTTAPSATASPTRSATGSGQPARRPNLLVIEADDMRVDDLRWMPQTRRLIARPGLTFHNSFAANPLCCPSRASFLTGKLSHNHRVLSHTDPFGFRSFDDSDTLATRLQAAGYRTALVGKYLNGYGSQPTRQGQPDSTLYVPPGWTEWWAGSDRTWLPGVGPGGNTYDYFHLTSNVNGTIRSWPGRYSTAVTAEQTRSLIDRFANRPRAPWFVWWTPIAPHHGLPREADDPGVVARSDGFPVTWVTPARPEWVKGRFDTEITGPPSPRRVWDERDVSDKPAYLRRTPRLSRVEQTIITGVARQRAEALFALDRQVGLTLRALERTGQADSTLVVFTSDNGYYLGEHRKRQGKISLHEPSIRVPLLVRGPGVPSGHRFDPISTVDLAVTLGGYAGVRLDDPDGTDFRDRVRHGDQGWRRPVLIEGRMPERRYAAAGDRSPLMSGLNTMGLRLGRWKLVRYATGETEVYDLAADPLEMASLTGERSTPVVKRLRRLWRQYAQCAGAACLAPLPTDLQLGPEANRRLTRRQQRAAASR